MMHWLEVVTSEHEEEGVLLYNASLMIRMSRDGGFAYLDVLMHKSIRIMEPPVETVAWMDLKKGHWSGIAGIDPGLRLLQNALLGVGGVKIIRRSNMPAYVFVRYKDGATAGPIPFISVAIGPVSWERDVFEALIYSGTGQEEKFQHSIPIRLSGDCTMGIGY